MDEKEAYERREVVAWLRAYDERITALMALVRRYIDSPNRADKDGARQLLGELVDLLPRPGQHRPPAPSEAAPTAAVKGWGG
jgi:hypothetical protein